MTDFSDLLKQTPKALEEYITLPECGGTISVYEGELSLKKGDRFINLAGLLYYSFAETI